MTEAQVTGGITTQTYAVKAGWSQEGTAAYGTLGVEGGVLGGDDGSVGGSLAAKVGPVRWMVRVCAGGGGNRGSSGHKEGVSCPCCAS